MRYRLDCARLCLLSFFFHLFWIHESNAIDLIKRKSFLPLRLFWNKCKNILIHQFNLLETRYDIESKLFAHRHSIIVIWWDLKNTHCSWSPIPIDIVVVFNLFYLSTAFVFVFPSYVDNWFQEDEGIRKYNLSSIINWYLFLNVLLILYCLFNDRINFSSLQANINIIVW